MPTINQISQTLHFMKQDDIINTHFDIESEEGYDIAYEAFKNISNKQYAYLKSLRGQGKYRSSRGLPGVFDLLIQFGLKLKQDRPQ
jgi:hypothetical protein